jgi:dolichol-phosphate mannosyltransferase
MNESQPLISIVSPMFNEESGIKQTIIRFIEFMESMKVKYEIIFVNDGSSDRTLELATSLENVSPCLRIISYSVNRGRGYALRSGISQSKGKYVITMESDLNYGTEIIKQLYYTLEKYNADIVVASPYMIGGKIENVPPIRAFFSSFGNKVLRMAVKSNIHTVTGMTRGYKGESIRKMFLEENGKEIHLEIISKAEVIGYNIIEIPATLVWPDKKKKFLRRKSSFKLMSLIKTHLIFATNEAPILLFGSIGGLFLLLGLILGFKLSYDFLIKEEIIGDRIVTILSTIFLIFSGTLVLLISFLSYQLRDLKKEFTKVKQLINEKRN